MEMIQRKYPRTFHLPFSPGARKDDRIAKDVSRLIGIPLLITEKMDGSNVRLARNFLTSRGKAGPMHHASFDPLKAFHASVCHLIPDDVEVFGEWLYAVHSIEYESLPTWLQVIGVRQGNTWWRWEDTHEMANELGATTVPVVLSDIVIDQPKSLRSKIEAITVHNFFKPTCGPEREGIVIRPMSDFSDEDFKHLVLKWVRKNHVTTTEHWKRSKIVINGTLNEVPRT